MWKAFQRYRALDPETRKLFWRAAVLLPWVAVCLRMRGFQWTREALQRKLARGDSVNGEHSGAETVETTCRMVRAGAHYGIGHPTCLAQSLVLWYLLRTRNVPARLRIGVKKITGEFEAHAWVECQGVALNQLEEAHRHYAAFESEFADLPQENA